MVIHLQFLVAAMIVLGILIGASLPVTAAVLPRLSTELVLAAAPVVGLAVLATFGWYWCSIVDTGLHPALLVFAFCLAALGVVVVFRTRPVVDGKAVRSMLTVAAIQLVVFATLSLPMTEVGEFTSVSIGNNDIAAYALVTDHLMEGGFSDADHVVGVNLARAVQDDVFGAYVLLSAAAGGTARPLWKVTGVAMAAASVAAVLALFAFSRRVFRSGRLVASVLAIVSCNTFLFSYMAGHYFLSQVLGIACAALLTAFLADSEGPTSLPVVGVVAAIMGAFVLTYPHMLIVGAPVWAGVALIAAAQRSWHTFRRSLAIGAIAGVVVAVALPVRTFGAFSRTLTLGNGREGFLIAAMAPSEVLGLQRSLSWPPSALTMVTSGVLVLALVIVTRLAMRQDRQATVTAVVAVVVTGAVYALLLTRYGDHGYPPAKWIAFFQPMVIIATGGVAACGIGNIPRFRSASAGAHQAFALACGAAAAVVAFNGHAALEPAYDGEAAVLKEDLYKLPEAPALARVSSVNVDVPTFWETLWGVYFLRERVVFPLSPYYYPSTLSGAPWTLVRRDSLGGAVPAETVEVNVTYVLVPSSSRPSASASRP